jgi:hypothetical protein
MKAVLSVKKNGHCYLVYDNGTIDVAKENGELNSMGCKFFSPAEMENLYWLEKQFKSMDYETKRLEQ